MRGRRWGKRVRAELGSGPPLPLRMLSWTMSSVCRAALTSVKFGGGSSEAKSSVTAILALMFWNFPRWYDPSFGMPAPRAMMIMLIAVQTPVSSIVSAGGTLDRARTQVRGPVSCSWSHSSRLLAELDVLWVFAATRRSQQS